MHVHVHVSDVSLPTLYILTCLSPGAVPIGLISEGSFRNMIVDRWSEPEPRYSIDDTLYSPPAIRPPSQREEIEDLRS